MPLPCTPQAKNAAKNASTHTPTFLNMQDITSLLHLSIHSKISGLRTRSHPSAWQNVAYSFPPSHGLCNTFGRILIHIPPHCIWREPLCNEGNHSYFELKQLKCAHSVEFSPLLQLRHQAFITSTTHWRLLSEPWNVPAMRRSKPSPVCLNRRPGIQRARPDQDNPTPFVTSQPRRITLCSGSTKLSLWQRTENNTYSIDLSISWTNSTVKINMTEKAAPVLNNEALWLDTARDATKRECYSAMTEWSLLRCRFDECPKNSFIILSAHLSFRQQ